MDAIANISLTIKTAVWVSRFLRKVGFRQQIVIAKQYVALQTLMPLHSMAIHEMRSLALDVYESNNIEIARQAMKTCTAIRNVLGNLLDLNEHELHCSIKLFDNEEKIGTWARSQPLDDRPTELDGSTRPISDGTPWCVVLGKDDGITRWREHCCFCCNDLEAAQSSGKLQIKRQNWARYYKSALVYPLVYRQCANRETKVIFGLLCFDSPRKKAFLGVPDIFNFSSESGWTDYRIKLMNSAPFHAGAILADTLSVFLRPFYEANNSVKSDIKLPL